MSNDDLKLEVYEAGKLTVVGFGGRDILEQINIAECREQIAGLVERCQCETLAFDLSGVRLIPSGMLGLLASLRDLGVEIQVFNPSDDVREVLEITKLDAIISVQEVDVQTEE